MQYATQGSSGLSISRIGFGCMSLKPAQEDAEALLRKALDFGINYFDTADLYDKGWNETLLGKVFKGDRKNVILATKVGNQWRGDGTGWDWNPSKAYILSAVEGSLRRLQTDYIDLYQLHGGTLQDPIEETIEAFESLVQQGKIRHYGISSIRPNVIRTWVERSSLVSVMLQYSLLDRRAEAEVLALLKEKGIGVLARGSLAQGLLVDKPAKDYLGYSEAEVRRAASAVQQQRNAERNPAQTALQFALKHEAVTATVVGMRNPGQLEEAVGAMAAPALSDEALQKLQTSIDVNRYTEHL